MKILHHDDGKKGRFFIEADGSTAAEMTYVWAGPQKIIIDHTEVDERLIGMNAGKQLLAEAVAFAREQNLKILPLCPFAAAQMNKTSEYQDVLF